MEICYQYGLLFSKLSTINQVCDIVSPVQLQKMMSEIASGTCKDSWPLNYKLLHLEAVELFSRKLQHNCVQNMYCLLLWVAWKQTKWCYLTGQVKLFVIRWQFSCAIAKNDCRRQLPLRNLFLSHWRRSLKIQKDCEQNRKLQLLPPCPPPNLGERRGFPSF